MEKKLNSKISIFIFAFLFLFKFSHSQTSSYPADSITATPVSLCFGYTSTLSVIGGSLGTGASWYWYNGACGGSNIGAGSTLVITPSSCSTYYVRAIGTLNTTSCVNKAITVFALSTAADSVIATPNVIYIGNSSTLTVAGGSLVPYLLN